MRQVSVDARGKDNRAEQFKVVTTILDTSIDGGQIGGLYERRWDGEVDIRSIKSTMKMGILRCKTPEMVEKEIWVHLQTAAQRRKLFTQVWVTRLRQKTTESSGASAASARSPNGIPDATPPCPCTRGSASQHV